MSISLIIKKFYLFCTDYLFSCPFHVVIFRDFSHRSVRWSLMATVVHFESKKNCWLVYQPEVSKYVSSNSKRRSWMQAHILTGTLCTWCISRESCFNILFCFWNTSYNIPQLLDSILSSSRFVPGLNSWSSCHPLIPQIKKK